MSRRIRLDPLPWVVLPFLAGTFGAGASGAPPPPEASQRRGVLDEPPPDVELPDLDGNLVSLRGFAGKIVIYDFWAVWCGPCEESLPFFQDLEDRYREDGLVVIGLHVDDQMPPPDEVRAFVEERGVRYRNLLSTVEADEAFRVFAMPTTYIADRDGVVRLRHIGFNPARTPERLEQEVRDLLGLE